jgi:3-hydroxybutyryl-CoA dehydratase
MQVRPHDRFAAEVRLTPATVSAYAHNVGDLNPVHYDPHYAAATRYQRPIASGAHTTGLLMGLTATHFSQDAAMVMVGLEFWFRFRRPIFADETIRLEWLVIAVRPNARLGGDIVDLRGRIRNQVGETVVGAKGRVLVAERL